VHPSWWKALPDLQQDVDQHTVMSRLGILGRWWPPDGNWTRRITHSTLIRHHPTKAMRRKHNDACINEELAEQARREPSLCHGWRGRRKWLVDTQAVWVVHIHEATVCKRGTCRQWHLHASHDAWLLHLNQPNGTSWATMPGGGGSWDMLAHATPPAAPPSFLEEPSEGTLSCTNALHVWITVGRGDGATPLFGAPNPFCHEHLVMPPEWMRQFGRSRSFWRNRWLLVHEYLQAHSTMRLAILSDAYDYPNPNPTSSA